MTDELICPWCGLEHADSGDDDLGLIECEDCGKSFYGAREVSISYSTEKATYGTCKDCGKEDVVIEGLVSFYGKYDGLCIDCGRKEMQRLVRMYLEVE